MGLRSVVFYMIIALMAMSCRAGLYNQTGSISGKVVWLEGNLMPSIDDDNYAQRAAGVPVQRMLYIYEATKPDQAMRLEGDASFYTTIHKRLVKKVRTDKGGTFEVRLPPGKYSIFVMENEAFFANVFDGEGHINPVQVEPGEETTVFIKINYKAFY